MDIKIINDAVSSPPPVSGADNVFIDRRKNSDVLLIILAGYKPFLFDDVFARLKAFSPPSLEICVTSSGLYNERLNEIAAENNWSYLSTAENNISLVQNLAIMLHKRAELIFKMDEDIFVTQNCFVKLIQTYEHVQREGRWNIGFVAPLIPINGYAHVRLLEKLGLVEVYEKKFERIMYGAQHYRMIEKSPEVAKFFWGEGNIVPPLDLMNAAFQIQKISYSVCSVRFSIGLILFHRNLWKVMGGWQLPTDGGAGIGIDEAQICTFCTARSLGMIISENVVVGHLSFGQQNEAMKEYYLSHREKFRCPI